MCISILDHFSKTQEYFLSFIKNKWFKTELVFTGGSVVKNTAANSGDTGDVGSIFGINPFWDSFN